MSAISCRNRSRSPASALNGRAAIAAANPAAATAFSVPGRSPRSCSPPRSSGCSATPRRYDQRADADRPAELVGGDGAEVDVRGTHRQAANGLRRVDVQQHPALAADGRDVGDRLHRADLAVRPADRDERRVRPERRGDGVSRHPTGGIDRQPGDRRTAPLQLTHRAEHRRVLDRRRHHVPSRDHGSEQRQIVRFRRATGETHGRRRDREHLSNRAAGTLEDRARGPARRMGTRRIANLHHGQHCVAGCGYERRCGVVVEVDHDENAG
jgi:hypothetical protein